jgi:hypothetical protein
MDDKFKKVSKVKASNDIAEADERRAKIYLRLSGAITGLVIAEIITDAEADKAYKRLKTKMEKEDEQNKLIRRIGNIERRQK